MNRRVCAAVLLLAVLVAAGCAKQAADTAGAGSGAAASASSSTATVSRFDAGPRAGEQPINQAKVEAGEHLFQTKGCSACHAIGRRISGPDLAGVTMRRTAEWMENQILHPEVMTKQDPISRGLLATYTLQMPNQGLTPEEAKSVIEYLKHENAELGKKK